MSQLDNINNQQLLQNKYPDPEEIDTTADFERTTVEQYRYLLNKHASAATSIINNTSSLNGGWNESILEKFSFIPENYININPVEIIFKDKKYIIHFATTFKDFNQTSDDIFETQSYNEQELMKSHIEGDHIYMENIVLFQITHIDILKSLITHICHCRANELKICIEKDYIRNLMINIPEINYIQFSIIGNNKLVFKSENIYKWNGTTNSRIYLDWYSKCSKFLNTFFQKNIEPLEFPLEILDSVQYKLIPKFSCIVNIMDMFKHLMNNQSNNIKMITVNYDKTDALFNGNNKTQYFYQPKTGNIDITHVDSVANCLVIYMNIYFSDNIYLNSIYIHKSGIITMNFKTIHQEISSVFMNIVERSAEKVFKNDLVMYNLFTFVCTSIKYKPTYDDYIKMFTGFDTSYAFISKEPFNKTVFDAITEFGYDNRYNTNTSVMYQCDDLYSDETLEKYYEEYINNKHGISRSYTNIECIPEILINYVDKTNFITFRCKKFTSIQEIRINIMIFLPLFKLSTVHDENNSIKTTKEIFADINDKNLSIDDIFTRLISIPSKRNLENLTNVDPVLFSSRNVGEGKHKSYSAICAQDAQRPSILNRKEFEIISEKYPERVSDLKNQTYGNRLYLCCSSNEYPYINYHYYANQPCIVRCTSKPSNRAQFDLCSNALSVRNSEHNNSKISMNILDWTENLQNGRRCRLPDILRNIFPDCVCIPYFEILNKYGTIQNWYSSIFKINACSLRAVYDSEDSSMEFYIRDINKNYIVFSIQIHNNHNLYFVVHEKTGVPLNVASNPIFLERIKKLYTKTIQDSHFIKGFAHIYKQITGFRERNDEPLEVIIDELYKKYNILFITNHPLRLAIDFILGYIKDNVVYPVSRTEYIGSEQNIVHDYRCKIAENIYKDLMLGRLKLPKHTDYDDEYMNKLLNKDSQYLLTTDLETLAGCIGNKDYDIPITLFEPVKSNLLHSTYKQCKIVDVESKILTMLGLNISFVNDINKQYNIDVEDKCRKILDSFLLNYVYFHKNFTLNDFIEYVLSFESIYDDNVTDFNINSLWTDKYSIKTNKKLMREYIEQHYNLKSNNNVLSVINPILRSSIKPPRNCEIKHLM